MKSYVLAAAMLMAASTAFAQAPAPNAELPADIKAYVTTHDSAELPYDGKIVVGRGLDGELIWQQLPKHPEYRWTNVNGQKVVVEKKTNHVVAIY